jgi:hypothetical protein
VRTLLIVLAALVVGFAPAPLPKRDVPPDGRKRLDGGWVVDSVKFCGSPMLGTYYGDGLAFRRKDRLTIAEGEVTFTNYAPRQSARWTIRCYRGTSDFDFVPPSRGRARVLGFYRQEPETLTLVFRSANSGRPKAANDEDVVTVLLKSARP